MLLQSNPPKMQPRATTILCKKKALELSISKAFMAEDMGLELVCMVQTLKFQGGNTPSTFVPGVVPMYIVIIVCR